MTDKIFLFFSLFHSSTLNLAGSSAVFSSGSCRSAEPIAALVNAPTKERATLQRTDGLVAMVTVCSLWFQLSDCCRGVVFDGLETLFARNAAIALLCLLKAIGNREYIYVLTMVQDYAAMKAQEKAKKEQEGKAHTPWAVLRRPDQVFPLNRALGLCKSFPDVITHWA